MPRYEVVIDGYEYGFDYPDENTPDEVLRGRAEEMARRYRAAQQGDDEYQSIYDLQKKAHSGVQGALAQMGHGSLLGYGDEINAALATLISGPEGSFTDLITGEGSDYYDKRLDINRRVLNEYRDKNPVLAPVMEGSGGVLTGLVAGRAGLGGTGSTLGQTAKIGATEGAIAGFGEGEGGFVNRAFTGGVGATFGGVAPYLLAAGRPAAQSVARNVGRFLDPGIQKLNKAQRLLMEDLRLDAFNPNKLRRVPGKQQTVADIGGANTLAEMQAAAAIPGNPMLDETVDFMSARRANQYGRITDDAVSLTGQSPINRIQAEDEILDAARREADDLYQAAYANPAQIGDLDTLRLLDSDIVKEAYDDALRLYDAERSAGMLINKDLPPLDNIFVKNAKTGQVRLVRSPNMQTLDYIQRALDDKVTQLYKDGKGGLAGIAKETRRKLISAMEKISPEYEEARQVWRGKSEGQDALKAGKKFWTASENDVANAMKDMSATEQALYRQSAMESIQDNVMRPSDTINVVGRLNNETMRRKLAKISTNPEAVENYLQRADIEKSMARTEDAILTGSRTKNMAAKMKAIEENPSLISRAVSKFRTPATAFDTLTEAMTSAGQRDAAGTTAGELLQLGATELNENQQKLIADLFKSYMLEREVDRIGMAGARSASSFANRMTPYVISN